MSNHLNRRISMCAATCLTGNKKFHHQIFNPIPAVFFSTAASSLMDALSTGETKGGIVKFFNSQRQFGFILPDGAPEKPSDKDLVFFLYRDIKKSGRNLWPLIQPQMRVQFKVAKADVEGSKTSFKAFDLTLEGGKLLPTRPYMNSSIKQLKSRFGEEVFDIMDSVTDQEEMERLIVQSFDKVKAAIDRINTKVDNYVEAKT